jgi:hypothetical protein
MPVDARIFRPVSAAPLRRQAKYKNHSKMKAASKEPQFAGALFLSMLRRMVVKVPNNPEANS